MTAPGAFLVDAMCGRLVSYLRFCGYDVSFAPDRGVDAPEGLVALAEDEGRTILTRNRSLDGPVIRLTATDVEGQLAELDAAGVDLTVPERPRRCGRCNGPLEAVADDVELPEYVADGAEGIHRCRRCGQFFWRGSHWDRMAETIARVTSG